MMLDAIANLKVSSTEAVLDGLVFPLKKKNKKK